MDNTDEIHQNLVSEHAIQILDSSVIQNETLV